MPDPKEKKGLAPTSKLVNQVVPPLGWYGYPWDIPFATGHKIPDTKMLSAAPTLTDTTPPKNYHPIGVREGMMEKLIKTVGEGNNFVGSDKIYLEQYLHPEVDVLPKQPLRPTQLSKMPNMEFRHVASEHGVPNRAGLGSYVAGKGKDYNSIYDVWDFDTPENLFGESDGNYLTQAKNYLAKKVMQNVGTPYAVYERYPKGYLSAIWDEPSNVGPKPDEIPGPNAWWMQPEKKVKK